MPAKSPRISVVIPVFNEPIAVLEQSLASVSAQTYGDFEALVIDESTRAETIAACQEICARDARFRYLRPEERIGLAASLNLGIAHARGEFIARFDSDDLCLPDRFAIQVAHLDSNPDISVLGSALEIMSETGDSLAVRHYPTEHGTIERQFMTTSAIAHPTAMIRKEVLDQFGGYDPGFRFAEDLDLWLRLLGQGVRFGNVTSVLVRYRQQNTRRKADHWKFNLRARLRNFGSRHLPRRVVGVAAIAVWRFVPVGLQEKVFKRMLLRAK
jgi:glycosyltransferase involved in cell wall biosynthesis